MVRLNRLTCPYASSGAFRLNHIPVMSFLQVPSRSLTSNSSRMTPLHSQVCPCDLLYRRCRLGCTRTSSLAMKIRLVLPVEPHFSRAWKACCRRCPSGFSAHFVTSIEVLAIRWKFGSMIL